MRKLILFGLLYLAMLVVARSARAQWLSLKNSEKVHSTLKTDIPSDKTAPFKVKVSDGDGTQFSDIVGNEGRWFIITIAPAPGAENANTAIEEDTISAVAGDSLTVHGRAGSNTDAHHWAVGSYIGVRVSFIPIKQIQDSAIVRYAQIDSIRGILGPNSFLPPQTGQAGKALTTNGATLSWTAQPGSVVPVSLGGTGLTTLASGKMLYAPSTGTIAPLSIGSGLTISGGVLTASLSASTTDALAEGATNLYFTNTRARSAISATTPVTFSGGLLTVPIANSTDTGLMTPAVYNSIAAKQSALTFPIPLSQGGTNATDRATAFGHLVPDTTGLDSVYLRKIGNVVGWFSGAGGGGGGGGGGTVSNFSSGNLSPLFTTSVATSTSTPALTFALTSASANLLFASPNGSSGAGSYRAMVVGDIPNALITNAKLANSSVTVTAGTGMTGGGSVSLGSSVTLTNDGVRQLIGGTGISVDTNKGIVTVTNAGVTSITGTANQVIASASTGAVTLSTPQSIGTGSSPTFAALTLTAPLPVADGGTGRSTLTAHSLQAGAGTSAMVELANGTTGQVLHANSGADPSWSAVSLATDVTGQLPTANIADSNVTAAKIATHAVDLTKQVSGVLPVPNGGTGQSTLTAGDVLIGNGTSVITMLAAGGTNTVLSGTTTPSYVTLATGSTMIGNGIGTGFDIDLTHANTWTAAQTINKADIRTTYTDGLTLTNATASDVSHTVQQSPSLTFVSHGWSPHSTATDSVRDMRITLTPSIVSNSNTAKAKLSFEFGNTSGYTDGMVLSEIGIPSSSGETVNQLKVGSIYLEKTGAIVFNGVSGLDFLDTGSTGSTLADLTETTDNAHAVFSVSEVNARTGFTLSNSRTATSGFYLRGNGTYYIGSALLLSDVSGTLAVANGGTNLTSYAQGDVLYASDGTTLSTLAKNSSATRYLANSGASNNPAWAQITLTNGVTGALPIANGGTNLTSYTTGDLLYASATNVLSKRAIGTSGDFLTVQAGVPGWTGSPTVSGNFTMNGGTNLHVSGTKIANYTATSADCVVPCDGTGGGFTITLPASPSTGQIVAVSKIDGSINAIAVAPNTGQSIAGIVSISLSTQGNTVTLIYMGGNTWIRLALM